MTDEIEEDSHSELPPSSSDKWMKCPAWRRLNHGIEDETSEAAEEGTLAHWWLEKALLGEKDLSELDNEEMYDHLQACKEFIEGCGYPNIHVEEKVDYGAEFGYVDLTGTADVIAFSDKKLVVMDLKYGRGLVEAHENTQLLCYLVGAVAKHGKRKSYEVWILQPRAYHADGPYRKFSVTPQKLAAFRKKLEAAIKGNYDLMSEPVAGEHCFKWCKAMPRCRAAAKRSLSLFEDNPIEYEED